MKNIKKILILDSKFYQLLNYYREKVGLFLVLSSVLAFFDFTSYLALVSNLPKTTKRDQLLEYHQFYLL